MRRSVLNIFKFFWRCYKSLLFQRSDVRVSPFAVFNQNTIFERHIVVHQGAKVSNAIIGRNTYICKGSNLINCQIGRFCSIGVNVQVVDATHPSSVFVSTSPTFFSTRAQNGQSFVSQSTFTENLFIEGKSCIIGNDVWIGNQALIRGGIKIGDGAIVAMGAVVTIDVPPYAIVAGVPAKIIRFRFNEDQISQLMTIRWWNKPDEWLKRHATEFQNIDNFLKSINI